MSEKWTYYGDSHSFPLTAKSFFHFFILRNIVDIHKAACAAKQWHLVWCFANIPPWSSSIWDMELFSEINNETSNISGNMLFWMPMIANKRQYFLCWYTCLHHHFVIIKIRELWIKKKMAIHKILKKTTLDKYALFAMLFYAMESICLTLW